MPLPPPTKIVSSLPLPNSACWGTEESRNGRGEEEVTHPLPPPPATITPPEFLEFRSRSSSPMAVLAVVAVVSAVVVVATLVAFVPASVAIVFVVRSGSSLGPDTTVLANPLLMTAAAAAATAVE